MAVEEMRKRIEKACSTYDLDDCKIECPLKDCENCYDCETDEEIKRNYELMFGKEESKMKNEFDFNELKAGYAIKVPMYDDELLVGIPYKEDLVFYSKNFNIVVSKEEILGNKPIYEIYIPIEVYGFSSNAGLFDPSTRPLLWKKEDKNFKVYEIGNLEIRPNYKEYKTEKEDFLFIENINENDEYVTIRKSELDAIINALIEIRDFIKENE